MSKQLLITILITLFCSLSFASANNKKTKGCHNAAYYGNFSKVKSCIKEGFEINKKDLKGSTMLQMAILGEGHLKPTKRSKEFGHNVKLINYLLPKSDLSTADNRGESLIHSLVLKVNEKTKDRYAQLLKQLIKSPKDLNSEDISKRTPLMNAVYSGNIVAVKLLLDTGADINYRNEYSYSVSKYLAISNNLQVLKLLVASGLDLQSSDRSGYTLMAQVVKYGKFEMFEYLINLESQQMHLPLESGRYIEARYDGTLFDIALKYNQYDIANLILSLGYPVDYQKKYGETALMEYAKSGDIKRLEYLVAKNANKHIQDDFNETALDKAEIIGKVKAIKALER